MKDQDTDQSIWEPFDVDYGSTMILDSTARSAEIRSLQVALRAYSSAGAGASTDLAHGVSVVIPSFQGRERISTALQSLIEQELDPLLFEIIIVVNGADDGTYQLARALQDANPTHQFRVLYQVKASAGAARNLGIQAARFRFLTFVDDDDYVGSKYLLKLLEGAAPDRVSIAPIINVSSAGEEDSLNALNVQIAARGNKEFEFNAVSSILGFNACKLIPTSAAKKLSYSAHLRSGEDICFMASLAVNNTFKAIVVSDDGSASYYRVLRDDSISRRPRDFDFAVIQRLDVIKELESLRTWETSSNDGLLGGLIRSQANFVKTYLDDHPADHNRVVAAIESFGLKDFPWSRINAGKARDLVVSYCFAPYSDTSAVVASKAIVERGRIVDVIFNDMSSVRNRDTNLETIAGRFIDTVTEIHSPPSFAGWSQISQFVSKGIAVADRRDALIGGYESLYSRVLWSGSHFLAALFKIRHPGVRWSAEFSDPLSTDAKGAPRSGDLVRDAMFEVFRRAVVAKGYPSLGTDNLFTWCEYLTYVLADELIFTNENQLAYMRKQVSDKRVRRLIEEKAIVRVHPTPPARSYTTLTSDYPLSKSVVNVGYFGAFYENRGLHEVLTALANAPAQVRRSLRLHIFTNKTADVDRKVQEMGLVGAVKAQGYRPYLEFLNLASQFDVLLVNDVERPGEMAINPFLPSKYSDYLGTGRPVWGLVDAGSPLSSKPLVYKSDVGNSVQAVRILKQILEDWRDAASDTHEVGDQDNVRSEHLT